MRPLVLHAFLWGVALSIVFGALLVAILRVNPEVMLNDYPPDIRARWGPMTPRTKRRRWIAAGTLLVALLATVATSLVTLPAVVAHHFPFWSAFVYFLVMFGAVNVFDWLVLDCALVYWRPQFVVLPGTEEMAGYRNYRFHFRGFLLGIPVVLSGSALAAAVVSLLELPRS